MKLIKVQNIEEFKDQLKDNEAVELAEAMLEAIQRGIKKNSKKVAVCDVEVEEDGEVFRLYSSKEDWHVALEGCLKAFIKVERYEVCSKVQEVKKELIIKKLLD
jgi:putative component of toxin-antitoxin plasmid stabilization module